MAAAKKAEETKEVAVKEEAGLPADLAAMMDEDTGSGFENVTHKDLPTPFLSIIQSNSPQVDRSSPKYIEGCKPGDIINTVTGETWEYGTKIRFIVSAYDKKHVEWVPREKGGGLVAQYDPDNPKVETAVRDPETNKEVLPNGNHLVLTQYLYIITVDDGGFMDECVISTWSTQLKKTRNLLAQLMKYRAPNMTKPLPLFGIIVEAETVGEQKDNLRWFGWKFTIKGPVTVADQYVKAKEFNELFRKGQIEVAAPPADMDDIPAATGGAPAGDAPY